MFRRSLLALVGLVLVAVAFLVYRGYRSPVTEVVPPDPRAEELEPIVAAAIREKRQQVLKEPKSASAWGDLGEVFLANELEDEARICFGEAGRLEPANYRWPYLEAIILVNRGDRAGAAGYLRRTLELIGTHGEDNLAPQLMLAEIYMHLGQVREAEPLVRSALDRKPEDPRVRFDAGLIAVADQKWETARTHFQRCLESPYSRQRARVQLAAVLRQLGDAVNAEKYQEEAAGMPADWEWPDPVIQGYLMRAVKKRTVYKNAEALEAQGRFTEAVGLVTPVAEQYPQDDVAQVLLGRLLAQLGDFPRAELALRQALKLAPQKVQPHYFLSLILTQEGELDLRRGDKARATAHFEEAVSLARAALAVKPDYGFAHMALGLALKNLGKLPEAAIELRQAVHCSPEYAEMHLRLAELLDLLGEREEARDRYAQALRLAPPRAPWRDAAQSRLTELQKDMKKPGG